MQVFILMLIVIGNYGTLKLLGKINILAYAFFPWASFYFFVTLVGACNLASNIHTLSSSFLLKVKSDHSWERERQERVLDGKHSRIAQLLTRSCRPLVFKISEYFSIRRNTLMILLYWCISHTVNLVLVS